MFQLFIFLILIIFKYWVKIRQINKNFEKYKEIIDIKKIKPKKLKKKELTNPLEIE